MLKIRVLCQFNIYNTTIISAKQQRHHTELRVLLKSIVNLKLKCTSKQYDDIIIKIEMLNSSPNDTAHQTPSRGVCTTTQQAVVLIVYSSTDALAACCSAE